MVSLPPPSNGEVLRGLQHNMSLVLDTRFYIWFIMTIYYKMWQLFYYKMWQKFITKCQVFYYKMWQFHYKMWQLLQNVMFVTNCNSILMLLVYKKTYQEIIQIKITKIFIYIVCFFNRNSDIDIFDSCFKTFPNYYKNYSWKEHFLLDWCLIS